MSTHFHVWGGGPKTFLGIHGWGGGWRSFEPLVPYLPRDARLVAPDLPGYGQTLKPPTWSLDAVEAAITEVVDHLDGPLTLVGNCSGAIFGMLSVLVRAGRFERLVLIDPFAYFPWYFRMMTWPVIGRIFYGTAFQNPIGRIVTNLGLAKHRTEDTNLTESFEALDHAAVFAHLQLLDAVGDFHRFEPIQIPIDLLIGARTFDAIRTSRDMWLSIWPHATSHTLAKAAHLPIEEDTRDLAEIAFYGKNDGRVV